MAVAEVIKYDGHPDVFAWKFPNSELGTWSQIIVNESQEAVLFKGGKALDVLQSGRHSLSTNNIPILSKLVNLPFGKKSPFSAEVWFVNKVHALDIKWGTSAPIQLQDPKYGIIVPVRSFGQFGIQITEPKKFLVKLVGTLPYFDKVNLVNFFRGLFVTKIKDSLSSYLITKKISILEINAYIDEISGVLKDRIAPTLEEYGISLVNFYVNDISTPENDTAVIKLKEALAKRAEMNIIGYDYQQERSFDTLEGAAKNTGTAGGVMGAGMGLGMGAGMGMGMGNQFGGIANQMSVENKKDCPNCNAKVKESAAFCPTCGASFSQPKPKENQIVCGKCGMLFKKGSKFCPECGDKYIPCPECGTDLAENSVKCNKCGHEFPIPCPKCGKEVKKGSKFCPECGHTLVKRCPKCTVEITEDTKFCPSCGEKT